MSIKVMTMVFDRYPEGGNERLLALALADHARDDGTRIWPSVGELARKTLQHRSTVQRQLARMVERGWLEFVHKATGRPGDTNEYRINAAWIAGGELPETGSKLRPLSTDGEPGEAVDKVIHTGRNNDETGRAASETGSTAMRPESSGTVKEPIPPKPPVETGGGGQLAKQPGLESTKAVRPKDRMPWRWADMRSEIDKRGEQLGITPWNRSPPSMGGEMYSAYAARVFASHLALQGVTTTPSAVQRAIESDAKWGDVLRQLATEAEKSRGEP